MSEENGKQPQPEQPQPGQIPLNVQVFPQGVLLSSPYPVQLGIPDNVMDDLSEQWVMQRPLLQQKIVQRVKKAQQQELAIIKHVNRSKRN